jgi:hypothetical protein
MEIKSDNTPNYRTKLVQCKLFYAHQGVLERPIDLYYIFNNYLIYLGYDC